MYWKEHEHLQLFYGIFVICLGLVFMGGFVYESGAPFILILSVLSVTLGVWEIYGSLKRSGEIKNLTEKGEILKGEFVAYGFPKKAMRGYRCAVIRCAFENGRDYYFYSEPFGSVTPFKKNVLYKVYADNAVNPQKYYVSDECVFDEAQNYGNRH